MTTTKKYNLTDEQRAELKRVLARILGRKATGEVVVNLSEGGVNDFKLSEPVKLTK
jgi:hypothetical protein